MNTLLGLFDNPFWNDLVTALLLSLPIGMVISILLYFLLKWIPAQYPGARYRFSLGALVLLCLSVIITVSLLGKPLPSPSSFKKKSVLSLPTLPAPLKMTPGSSSTSEFQPQISVANGSIPSHWRQWSVLFWLCGSFFMITGVIRQIAGGTGLRLASKRLEDPSLLRKISVMQASLSMARPVELATSRQLYTASVIGILKPTILLPASRWSRAVYCWPKFISPGRSSPGRLLWLMVNSKTAIGSAPSSITNSQKP